MDHSVPSSGPSSQEPSRRRFMKGGVALGAALVAGAARPGSGDAQSPSQPRPAPDDPSRVVGGPMVPYGERSRFEDAMREKGPPSMPDEWGGNFTPLEEMLGIITPSALHYEVCRGGIPDIDPRKHRLLIHGMVDRPLILTMVRHHALGLHQPVATLRRARLAHGRTGLRGDGVPALRERDRGRARRHRRPDAAAGEDAQPVRIRARPTPRRGEAAADQEALRTMVPREATPRADRVVMVSAPGSSLGERIALFFLTRSPLGTLVQWVARRPASIHVKLLSCRWDPENTTAPPAPGR